MNHKVDKTYVKDKIYTAWENSLKPKTAGTYRYGLLAFVSMSKKHQATKSTKQERITLIG
jgi:hypothetical protein